MVKYMAVLEVVRHASFSDTPEILASIVRRLAPHGHNKPERICEDLNRIARRGGHFTKEKAGVTRADIKYAKGLIHSIKRRGLWVTR